MKKIVVTGGSGFIGSNLIQLLLKRKFFVINIDKSSYSANPYNVKDFKKNNNYLFYKLDINNKEALLKILKKYKPLGIFNLAAETHVDRSIDDAQNFIRSNILGVYNLLECIRKLDKKLKNKIKFFQVSTDEVYGDIPNNQQASEKYNYNPSSPYSASKAGADQIIRSYTRTYKIKTLIANPCNNYGPNQFPEKFIPKMIFNILNNKPLPIYGKGRNVREWIYVQDTCEALLKIFLKGKIGESYNIKNIIAPFAKDGSPNLEWSEVKAMRIAERKTWIPGDNAESFNTNSYDNQNGAVSNTTSLDEGFGQPSWANQ